MSVTTKSVSQSEAATNIQNATDKEIWEAIGKDIQTIARNTLYDFVAIEINVNATKSTDLKKQVHTGFSVPSDSREYLDNRFCDQFKNHIIIRSSNNGTTVHIEQIRDEIVETLSN